MTLVIKKIEEIFNSFKPDIVVNLAAQAGVRYSIENPSIYIESNILGLNNILEASVSNNVVILFMHQVVLYMVEYKYSF